MTRGTQIIECPFGAPGSRQEAGGVGRRQEKKRHSSFVNCHLIKLETNLDHERVINKVANDE